VTAKRKTSRNPLPKKKKRKRSKRRKKKKKSSDASDESKEEIKEKGDKDEKEDTPSDEKGSSGSDGDSNKGKPKKGSGKKKNPKASGESSKKTKKPAADDDDKYNSRRQKTFTVKVGMLGDSEVGKTSLMVRYVEGKFDEDYICTLGVNFMEKTISIRNHEIRFSIWDLGGSRQFLNMLPLVCNDARAVLFMFDLSKKSTLINVKEWFRQARGHNKTALPFLVGTKYDIFANLPQEEQEDITKQARKFAKAMKAPLIFTSAHASINVQKIFKIILAKTYNLKCTIPQVTKVGAPILEYSLGNTAASATSTPGSTSKEED